MIKFKKEQFKEISYQDAKPYLKINRLYIRSKQSGGFIRVHPTMNIAKILLDNRNPFPHTHVFYFCYPSSVDTQIGKIFYCL
jgi:hypothetical protein